MILKRINKALLVIFLLVMFFVVDVNAYREVEIVMKDDNSNEVACFYFEKLNNL